MLPPLILKKKKQPPKIQVRVFGGERQERKLKRGKVRALKASSYCVGCQKTLSKVDEKIKT